MKIKHTILLILSLFILSGCQKLVEQIIVAPIIVGTVDAIILENTDHKYMPFSYPLDATLGMPPVDFELNYSWSTLGGERLSLKVDVKTEESIPEEGSLSFIVDNKTFIFSSDRKPPKLDYMGENWSSRYYVVSKVFIDKILSAEKVLVRVKLDKTYAEADFATENTSGAKNAIKEFMAKLESCRPTRTCRKSTF